MPHFKPILLHCILFIYFFSDVCKNCDTALCHSVEINSNEFSTLQHLIKELALKDNGIFSKTSPEELQKFSTLISERSYDVVIDGFGISLSDRRISDLIERTDLVGSKVLYVCIPSTC